MTDRERGVKIDRPNAPTVLCPECGAFLDSEMKYGIIIIRCTRCNYENTL